MRPPAKITNPHHIAWLAAHPNRSEEWLRERLRDGFDVHHIDGNHDNDNPLNLVLIEHADHMQLHGLFMIRRVIRAPRDTTIQDRQCYQARSAGKLWREVVSEVFKERKFDPSAAMTAAKRHAISSGLKWPPITRTEVIRPRLTSTPIME